MPGVPLSVCLTRNALPRCGMHSPPQHSSAVASSSGAWQGAYGILVEVESHPFPLDTMLFMDWRDDFTASDPQMQAANRCATPHGPGCALDAVQERF